MKKHTHIVVGLITTSIVAGFLIVRSRSALQAITDTCFGVPTTFTATAPSSVETGKNFTISNITSRPDTSYGVTVTSATLGIAATNASPTTYSQATTSTDPSPTTGAPTYTAYYPNWTLTASGSAGSSIVVSLSSVAAEVTGIGTINCPLTATLATINITAPAAPTGGSGGSPPASSGTSNNSNSTTTKATGSTTEKKTEETTSSESSQDSTVANESSADEITLVVVVKKSNGQQVKNAKVTLDNLPAVYTDGTGKVSFKDISAGNHTLGISFNGKKVIREIKVDDQNGNVNVAVQLPSSSLTFRNVLYGLGASMLSVVALVTFFIIRMHRHSTPEPPQNLVSPSPPTNNAQLNNITSIDQASYPETQPPDSPTTHD